MLRREHVDGETRDNKKRGEGSLDSHYSSVHEEERGRGRGYRGRGYRRAGGWRSRGRGGFRGTRGSFHKDSHDEIEVVETVNRTSSYVTPKSKYRNNKNKEPTKKEFHGTENTPGSSKDVEGLIEKKEKEIRNLRKSLVTDLDETDNPLEEQNRKLKSKLSKFKEEFEEMEKEKESDETRFKDRKRDLERKLKAKKEENVKPKNRNNRLDKELDVAWEKVQT